MSFRNWHSTHKHVVVSFQDANHRRLRETPLRELGQRLGETSLRGGLALSQSMLPRFIELG